MRVYEQLGDLCAHSRIGFYHAAVNFYLKEVTQFTSPAHKPSYHCVVLYSVQLNLATDHGVEPRELSKIFFSLAVTLTDIGQYEEALSYYEKELEMWSGNPAEVHVQYSVCTCV